jgi:hypothetical protein
MKTKMEFAGGADITAIVDSRSQALSRAPQWWRSLANRGLRQAAAEKFSSSRPGRATATPPATPRWAGWIAGVACCGVSRPAHATPDGRRLREQFTDVALAALAKQAGRDIPLTWGHGGRTLCSTRGLDMALFTRPLLGLCFQARLLDTADNRRALQAIGEDVIGVSIAFTGAKGWTVERDDAGEIRIINSATIDHVALLPPGSQQRPAYPAAWAAAAIGHRDLCPSATKTKAEQAAYVELKKQAGIRC